MAAGGIASESEFRDKMAKVDDLLKGVESNVNKMFQRGNLAAGILPGGLGDGVGELLKKLKEVVEKFFAEVGKILVNPGWPASLYGAGNSWVDDVGGPVSDLSGQVTPGQMRIDRFWSGPAATAYAAVLPDQQKALDAVVTATNSIDSQLTSLANGILAFWGAVVLAFIEYVAQLAVEAGATASGVGLVAGLTGAIVSTQGILVLLTGIAVGIAYYVDKVNTAVHTINQTLQNNSAFPAGKWPEATTSDYADASVSDGDTTDWHVNT